MKLFINQKYSLKYGVKLPTTWTMDEKKLIIWSVLWCVFSLAHFLFENTEGRDLTLSPYCNQPPGGKLDVSLHGRRIHYRAGKLTNHIFTSYGSQVNLTVTINQPIILCFIVDGKRHHFPRKFKVVYEWVKIHRRNDKKRLLADLI